jgi:two-component system CheB/CheR fusion protein
VRKRPPRSTKKEFAAAASAGSFPIVGVGASAGGLEAFTELLKHLPLDSNMGFVLVQHLDPDHDSALTQILGRATALPVLEAADKLRVQPNHIYIISPNTNLTIAQGVLRVSPRAKTRVPQHSIDTFFDALAEDQHERAIGVILSGTASDGTLGLESIKAEGGITFAQDDSARYDAMPRSAVAAGCVDYVLAPRGIASELARIAKHPYIVKTPPAPVTNDEQVGTPADDHAVASAHADDATPLPSGGHGTPDTGARRARAEASRPESPTKRSTDNGYKRILQLLHGHAGVDFSLYKSSTIQRRIARRMVLTKHDSPARYAEFVRGNAKELDALYTDVLISVTSFFRNPEAFEILKSRVLARLLAHRGTDPLRVWVLGCSTGQEAYSIAMSYVEASDKAPHGRDIQIFATDLNDALLDKARAGLYARSLAQDISPERLRRFFVEEGGGYRVAKSLREKVVFARQNLISDPPFSRMDLISCRNLLIYLEPTLQKKALQTFHYALRPDGFLFLGGSESVGTFTNLFDAVDKKHKIYARKPAPAQGFHLPIGGARGDAARHPAAQVPVSPERVGAPARGELDSQREADRISLGRYAPPGVLINSDLQVQQFRGATGGYLEPPKGKASFDLLKMAREGLMLPLRAAINKARKENKPVRKENVQVSRNGSARSVSLEVIPLRNVKERSFLILFEEAKRAAGSGDRTRARGTARLAAPPTREETRRITELEIHLAETREYLQSVQEQGEAANEELQAANEEVQSANEELQSINEELETSKEELESANEELTTVNEEMATRNTELSRLNSDLVNLQTSTRLPIVLLGRDLTVRRFSTKAEHVFGLHAPDVDRPIRTIRHDLISAEAGGPSALPLDLGSLAADVVASVRETEREVRDREGRWHLLRLTPYFTADNKVDGVVLVLIDIDAQKRGEQAIADARDYAEAIVRTVRDPVLVLDEDLRVQNVNEAFYRTFGGTKAATEGHSVYDLMQGQWNLPQLRKLLEDILPRNSSFEDYEITEQFAGMGRRTLLLNARVLKQSDRKARILLGVQDVTERLAFQAAARADQLRYKALVDASAQIVWSADAQGYVVEDSPTWRAFTGQSVEERKGSGWLEAVHPEDRERVRQRWHEAVARDAPSDLEYQVRRRDGGWRWMQARAVPLRDASGGVHGWIAMNIDIGERKSAEESLRYNAAALEEADRRKDEFLALLAHELRGPLAPLAYSLGILRRARDDPDATERARASMQRQLDQMSRLVDDLLDMSRIKQGKVELRRRILAIAPIVQEAIDDSRPFAMEAGHELVVSLPSQSLYVNGDAARVVQILNNLLGNAIKYTPPGGRIELTVRSEGDEVVMSVRDNGVGMATDLLPEVFTMFMQIIPFPQEAPRSRGLGIGLALVRQLVELHGGTVQAMSEGVGHGSEFVVRLPRAEEPGHGASQPSARVPPVLSRRRVLVADDDVVTADTLAELLRLSGHEVDIARNGQQAIDMAERLRPDVILLDLGMPGVNGLEAARRIRARSWGLEVVLIALTGLGREQDRAASAAAGFDAHLVKPVDPSRLESLFTGSPPVA